jgi:hypothetical protein
MYDRCGGVVCVVLEGQGFWPIFEDALQAFYLFTRSQKLAPCQSSS